MNTIFENKAQNTKYGMLKTSLFSLYENHFVMNHKEGEKVFSLNEISNVRFLKKRNFSINIFLCLLTILIYSFLTDYFEINSLWNIFLFIITIALSIISLSIENYNYVLYINMRQLGFKKLRLSKKDEPYAVYYVSFFKNDYKKV
ncbi:hypothetical protein [Flavobacterium franklandianum]|uniref:hypothetical protein n=1 Tax=Flavobacterium franklandianum TaxID=2594430 RepID=UPI001182154B|nr:hypothetical protein [Flavobacterium franklandianum]